MLRRLCVRCGLIVLLCLGFAVPAAFAQDAQPPKPEQAAPSTKKPRSPWILLPLASSNPKLGTAGGAMGAYTRKFDPDSRMSLFGMNYQYSTTHSSVAAAFARTSFAADHQRLTVLGAFGFIKNDYDDYLGSGQPLQTNDDLKAFAARYLYRVPHDWFVGAQGNAANYQVLGETAQDDEFLETLGVRGFKTAGIGAVVMHDSRDDEDKPTRGWFANINNVAYREGLGGSATYDAYRADVRAFWPHGRGHVLAFRQFNWLTYGAPATGQATVVLRGYKLGEYLAPFMSSFEAEERLSINSRWGVTLFAGAATLYGTSATTAGLKDLYPTWGGGVHFVLKPGEGFLINFEYASGIESNRGAYLKFGYAW